MICQMAHPKPDIDQLAHLCRIKCSEEEVTIIEKNLGKILDYMDLLEKADTEGLEPCVSVLETMNNVMREDTVGSTLDRSAFLENAPDHVGGMIKVPPVIQFEQES